MRCLMEINYRSKINLFLIIFLSLFLCISSFPLMAEDEISPNEDYIPRPVSPIYASTVENDKANGPSDFILSLQWEIKDDNYHAGDYFKITLPSPAIFPSDLVGQTTAMVDESGSEAGYVTISDSKNLLATFNNYVENKIKIRGTIKANFKESEIRFGKSHPFEIKINDEDPPFTPGSIRGVRASAKDYFVVVKGGSSFDESKGEISWYAMLNVNESDARNIKYFDMPQKGHKIILDSITVSEAQFTDNLGVRFRRYLSKEEFSVRSLPDSEGILRGFELNINNEEPASYYVSYKTKLLPEELKLGIINVSDNGKPIFENSGQMEWLDKDNNKHKASDAKKFTAKNFTATIEGENNETTSSNTSSNSSSSIEESTSSSLTSVETSVESNDETSAPSLEQSSEDEVTSKQNLTLNSSGTETINNSSELINDTKQSTTSKRQALAKTGEQAFTIFILLFLVATYSLIRIRQTIIE